MIINHNISALNTYRQLGINNSANAKSMEKLSSGLRINKAGDDAAGLAISEKMRAQVRGLDQASRNSQDGISMIQTAEGALQETQNILQRMRELATQAANDTNVDVDRNEIQKEMNQLTSEINRIGNTTEFNTQKLLNGDRENTRVRQDDTIGGTITGMKASLAPTATLAAGDYTLEVKKEATITTTAATMTAPHLKAKVENGGFNFEGGKISVADKNDSVFLDDQSGSKIEITRTGDNELTVKITNATDTENSAIDVITADADGKFKYNNHGVNFTINGLDDTENGEKVTIDLDGHSTATDYGVNQQGWTSLDVDTSGVTPASPTFVGGKINVDTDNVDVMKGTWTGTIDTSGATGKLKMEFVSADGKTTFTDEVAIDSTSTDKFKYDAHGISFEIDMDNVALNGNTAAFKFDIEEEYALKGTLKDSNGDAVQGAQNITLVSGYDGTGTTGTSINSIGGINLEQTGALDQGTFSLEIEENYTGTDKSANFQIGANQNQSLNLSISDMRSVALGISGTSGDLTFKNRAGHEENVKLTDSTDVTDGTNANGVERALDVSTHENAAKAITVINNAIEKVSSERSKLGATQNRLEHTISNLNNASENLTAAESRIRDVDMANEVMEMTRANILSQASQAMLAQANQKPQSVLQLLG